MKFYWKLYAESFSNKEVIRGNHNPIRDYEDELIEGPVIDIGCGQSPFLLEFATTTRRLFALDNEPFQLALLKQRVLAEPDATIENWHFLGASFPDEPLPDQKYALIVLSNLLHFFTLSECLTTSASILPYTVQGSLVYVKVHSHRHYVNRPDNPARFDYFKHYFTAQDLERIFRPEDFERIYLAEIDKLDSAAEIKFTCHWLDEWFKHNGITNSATIEQVKQDYLASKSQSEISAIFKKR